MDSHKGKSKQTGHAPASYQPWRAKLTAKRRYGKGEEQANHAPLAEVMKQTLDGVCAQA
jgi:hypothetical protein